MALSNTDVSRFLAQNYYSKTQLNSGQLDTRYFAESEYLNTSAGAGDAGKPVKLDASGLIDSTMVSAGGIDHGGLAGLSDDDHTGYALLAGRSGGQVQYGGTAANDDITISGTSHATKTTSYVKLQPSGGFVGVGTASPTSYLDVVGPAGTISLLRIGQTGVSNGLTVTSNGSILTADMIGNLTVGSVAVPTISSTDTLTNKTLTAPVIASISNSGTITIPTGTDTLVARDTIDTLTGKTLITPTIGNFSGAQHAHTGATSGGTIAHTALTSIGTNTHAQIDTHIADTATAHGATGEVVGTTNTQTLTNKTLTSPTINGGSISTPVIATIYGSSSANGDITIHGTSNATRTTSFVLLNPTAGNVGIGTTSPDYLFEAELNSHTLAFAPDYTANENYIISTDTGALGPLTLYGSAVKVAGDSINIAVSQSPASGGTGVAGEIAWDTGFLYVCTATNTWERVALTGGY